LRSSARRAIHRRRAAIGRPLVRMSATIIFLPAPFRCLDGRQLL
jgi:hypothetical protein